MSDQTGIPLNFQDGTDATLDGRKPISAGPPVSHAAEPAQPAWVQATEEQFNARVNAEVNRRVEVRETEHQTALSTATEQGVRTAALATLQAMVDGNPGDTVDALKFRGQVQDMILAIHNGNEKPPAEFVADAMKLNEARIQTIAAAGGDGAHVPPSLEGAVDNPDGQFSMGRFLTSLGAEVQRQGDRFSFESMDGSAEIEFAKTLLDGNDRAQRQFAAIQAQAGPRGRVIPFPLAALRPEALFAETRSDVATRREPTYRRDALVPFFRPPQILAMLGVPMPMISNDITLPRLTASMSGGWYSETGTITDESLTVGTQTTSPKRFGSRDDISWMLMTSGDSQFGHQALITSEMARAQMQRKERQVYDKQGAAVTNAPQGILRASGVQITALAANTFPTFANVLEMITEIGEDSIPVEMGAFVLGHKGRQDLSTVQRFSTGGGQIFNDTLFRESDAGPGFGTFEGALRGIMAGHPAFVTSQIPVYTSADSPIRVSDTYVLFGVWNYVWCIDYGTAFLTIDDVSLAVSGQTRITLNSFHDVAVRLPQAFSAIRYDAG